MFGQKKVIVTLTREVAIELWGRKSAVKGIGDGGIECRRNVEDFGSKRDPKVWKLARKGESPALLCVNMYLVHMPTQQLPSAFPHPPPQFPLLIFQS